MTEHVSAFLGFGLLKYEINHLAHQYFIRGITLQDIYIILTYCQFPENLLFWFLPVLEYLHEVNNICLHYQVKIQIIA